MTRTRKNHFELLRWTRVFGLDFNAFQLVEGVEPRTAAELNEGKC